MRAQLNRRIDEALGHGMTPELLVMRMNTAFMKADITERLESLQDVESLSDVAVAVAMKRLSHKSYDRSPDLDPAADLAARRAS